MAERTRRDSQQDVPANATRPPTAEPRKAFAVAPEREPELAAARAEQKRVLADISRLDRRAKAWEKQGDDGQLSQLASLFRTQLQELRATTRPAGDKVGLLDLDGLQDLARQVEQVDADMDEHQRLLRAANKDDSTDESSDTATTEDPETPDEVAMQLADPMTKAVSQRHIQNGLAQVANYPGGQTYQNWVMDQYDGAADVRIGPSPRSVHGYQVAGSKSMSRQVSQAFDDGRLDQEWGELYANSVQQSGLGIPEGHEIDHGAELQHVPGGDHVDNWRAVPAGLHRTKSKAMGKYSRDFGAPERDRDSLPEQHDHIAEVDLSDPNVGWYDLDRYRNDSNA